ncbi:MAG: N-6 DNA methylase [Deltaproteobacteria bacterium]|nr:N-6 DNA methylase [Deltaproteobacteria bacterium]
MAPRRHRRRSEAQLAFEALAIEGGLLSPEWLARVAQLQADAQAEADYRVPRGLGLRDEIGRYWRIAQALWADLATGRAAGADPTKLGERFALGLLREAFGFGTLVPCEGVEIAGRSYPVRLRALGGRVPVVVAPSGLGLDTAAPAFGDGGRRRSAFGLCQELLNADDGVLWGIATDAVHLRILRDNGSLTRPAWVQADLGRIFAEQRYADFAALWLLAHESRFGSPDKPVTECALETWRSQGREQGTRAREHLRRGVEDALVDLGQGFLAHPDNARLRAALQDGSLATTGYFQQLLRLVYRLIFLLAAEEREVLHAPAASKRARDLYAEGYAVRRLRDRAVRRSAHDRFGDLWQGLQIVLRGLARGEPRLGLPALGGLFAPEQCPALDAARLENRHLLYAIFRLSWLRDEAGLSRVNWRDMGPEELGSVYESLLELVPQVGEGGRTFAFATGGEARGHARKTTGSYYTPDSLVQVLLDSALEPVIAETIAKTPDSPADALLGLCIVDPACGSGHFLLAAARRLAAHVARLHASGTPSAEDYRRALRQVVGRSVFGVDLNPMAVELCKVSLWMEAVEPGRPLTFLDAHVQCGNALLGTTPDLLAKGIPDEAWAPIEGDDRKIASALKKQNKRERSELTLDFGAPPASTYARLGDGARAVDDAADETLDAVTAKGHRWQELLSSGRYEHARFVADLWCSAFVWRKQPGPLREAAPTYAVLRAIQQDAGRAPQTLRDEVGRLREQCRFFHWHLAFPQVFAKGGFDVVLGNPPWERVKLQEQEFFAPRSEEIAGAANAAARKTLIAALPKTNPQLSAEWTAASRQAEGYSHFVRQSGR